MRKCLIVLTLFSLLLYCSTPAFAAEIIQVFYAGPDGNVPTALSLSDTIELVTDPLQADVFVLNGVTPDFDNVLIQVRQGAGMVLILGPDVSASDMEPFTGPVNVTVKEEPLSMVAAGGMTDPLITAITWTSSPQVRSRSVLSGETTLLDPIVVGFEEPETILSSGNLGEGRVFLLNIHLEEANPQFQDWAYFNYFIYHLTSQAGGQTPLDFASYSASPVPHKTDRVVLLSVMTGLVLLSFLIFWFVRRYSLAHPEALDVLLDNPEKFAIREAGTQWEEIGFHRPLGGFLLALMLGLLMFIPLIIYQNLVLPVYILPSAQALGIWGRVVQFFNLAWLFFDMGTSIAFVKYLSQYRVNDPRKGMQFGQVFVWWQILSGAVQVALVIALASTIMPRSAYAIYAWSVVIHALIQLPGFYQIMRHALYGLQRYDYAQMVDLAWGLILGLFIQPVVVSLMYLWGKSNPVFGAAMGGLLGMGIAAYFVELFTYVIGWLLFRRLGYNARLLFLAHFDWEIIKQSFRFGVFEMLGSIAWAAGQAAEIWITQARLINYAEIWGNWGLAQNFIYAYQVLSTLMTNMMPSISEAISHGRQKLSQYYTVQAYKYGGLISAFIGAVLLAVADRFILGASGPEFVRAAVYAVPLIIWGAIQYPSWVGDTVQLGSNRPYLKSILVGAEQAVRIILAALLLQRLQINALIIAYFVGLLSKGFAAYLINHRVCFPQRFYPWQSLIAPLLAGGIHFLWLRTLTGLIWQGDQVTSVIIFFIGILPSFPIFTFLYGLLGGWDDATLDELRQAVNLASFMKPFAWIFWASTALGARISPLHNRFPITIREEALEEARTLTEERVDLLNAREIVSSQQLAVNSD